MDKQNGLLVVVALHTYNGRPEVSPLLITGDLVQALETARGAEKLGYEFGPDDGIGIFRLVPGRRYARSDFAATEENLPSRALLYLRCPSPDGKSLTATHDPDLIALIHGNLKEV